MSAGMVQLDERIRSTEKIQSEKECVVQKCVRYFDINNVGDVNHLSFFEMAGAFEIGDFKETKTIFNLWEYLTEFLKLNKENLWVSVFKKEEIVFLPNELNNELTLFFDHRVVYGDKKTNFWHQGGGVSFKDNMRLCGPQVEFFYDFGLKNCQNKNCNPFCSCGRFLELSNVIFIKYYIDLNQEPKLKELKNPATEAVIGLERLLQIYENKNSIFETTLFYPLIKVFGNLNLNEDIKIIADHIKSLTFILSEQEILPGKSDRNRIIRTLIRNLLTSFYVLKLSPQEYLPRLIDAIFEIYASVYPEITGAKNTVLKIIYDHEVKYKKTLEVAKRKIQKYIKENNIQQVTPENKKYFWEKFGISPKLVNI